MAWVWLTAITVTCDLKGMEATSREISSFSALVVL